MSARVFTRPPRARADERGFTLLELLAATVASLMVVIAALMLSRGANRLFAGESNVGASQFSLRSGVDRLRTDLERAGFMTTANGHADPNVCPDPTVGTPKLGLQSVMYTKNATPTEVPLTVTAGLGYDGIRLQGNYNTTDTYLVSTIDTTGSNYVIYLQRNTGAVARLLAVGETGSADAVLKHAFPVGGVLRLTNLVGSSQFLVVADAGFDGAGIPTVSARTSPPLTKTAGLLAKCGAPGGGSACMGCTVNPVSTVDYYIGSLKSRSEFAWAYPSGTTPADKEKYDLIRRVTDVDGGQTFSIVAEYVVDLSFTFSADTSAVGSGLPNVVAFPFGDARNANYGDDVLVNAASQPQRIRSIRYRMATRAHLPDRVAPADDGGPGLMRYQLGTNEYARVRTVFGEVTLLNHQGLRW